MNDTVYDRLIDEAHAAQAARNGDAYKAAQTELGQIDTDLIAKQTRREQVCAVLEGFETAIETTKDALTQHIASTYLASDLTQPPEHTGQWPAESDDGLFEDITPIPTDEDEYASAKANGALS